MFQNKEGTDRTTPRTRDRLLLLASLSLIALAFLADYFNPIGVADGFLYVLPVLITLWGLDVRSTYFVTVVDSVAIFSAITVATTGNLQLELINRIVAVMFIWLIAYLVVNRRRLEQDLVRSREEVGFLLDLLTHDINNLNAAASGYLQLVAADHDISERDRGFLNRSLEAIDNSSRLINEVVRLQNISAKEPDIRVIDVDDMLARTKELYEQPPGRDVRITVSSSDGRHLVYANEVLMEVFANLVTNAIKHSQGPLAIDMNAADEWTRGRRTCRITIADNGPGIGDELKRSIFSRSKRGRTAATGRGLGLYIVRSIISSFGGDIRVEDRIAGYPGQGAAFVITLPAAP